MQQNFQVIGNNSEKKVFNNNEKQKDVRKANIIASKGKID